MDFQGKYKAVTFSFDDGVTQDRRLVAMLNRYGLRGTFNLNSGMLGWTGVLTMQGRLVQTDRIQPEEVGALYRGHEIAVHTLTHPNLADIADEAEIIRQVEEDRRTLEQLAGESVVGMAYPYGGGDDRVVEILGRHTAIRYARTVASTGSFDLPENPLRLNPTVHAGSYDRLMALGEQFIDLCPDRPQLFYVWAHSYEFDLNDGWNRFEAFCRLISGHSDIAYLNNREALL